MKKIVFAALTLLSAQAFSQTTDKTENPEARKAERQELMQSLNLNDTQKEQLKELNRGMKEDRTRIEQDASLTEAQKQEKIRNLRKEHQKKLNEILTPEQATRLQDSRKEVKKD